MYVYTYLIDNCMWIRTCQKDDDRGSPLILPVSSLPKETVELLLLVFTQGSSISICEYAGWADSLWRCDIMRGCEDEDRQKESTPGVCFSLSFLP